MSAMGLGIAVGLNAVISKALGEGDQKKVKKTASAALVQAVSSVLAIYVNSVLMVITPTAVAVYGACVKIQGLGLGVQSMLLTLGRQMLVR